MREDVPLQLHPTVRAAIIILEDIACYLTRKRCVVCGTRPAALIVQAVNHEIPYFIPTGPRRYFCESHYNPWLYGPHIAREIGMEMRTIFAAGPNYELAKFYKEYTE